MGFFNSLYLGGEAHWMQLFEELFNDVSVMDPRTKAGLVQMDPRTKAGLVQIDTSINPILAYDLQCGSDK